MGQVEYANSIIPASFLENLSVPIEAQKTNCSIPRYPLKLFNIASKPCLLCHQTFGIFAHCFGATICLIHFLNDTTKFSF